MLALGDRVEGLEIGQTVAYAASGHAEVAAPSINHVVPVPDGVDLRHAAFVTVGGIAMQSLRRADLKFGETVAIYGLGLVGQLCASIAKAAGCVVVGIDINPKANELATAAGAALVVNPSEPGLEAAHPRLHRQERGRRHGHLRQLGLAGDHQLGDGDHPAAGPRGDRRLRQARHPPQELPVPRDRPALLARVRARAATTPSYEKGRVDYPFGYVRWTEKRNLEEFIRLVATGAVNPEPLIAGVYPVERAQEPFDAIRERTLPGVAALISYGPDPDRSRTMQISPRPKRDGKVGISLIGFGNHVLGMHLPNLKSMRDVELRGIASATGRNASVVAKGLGATMITTDVDELLADEGTDAVMICSNQPDHYEHIRAAISAGKAVFIEKPMVTRLDDFGELLRLMEAAARPWSRSASTAATRRSSTPSASR